MHSDDDALAEVSEIVRRRGGFGHAEHLELAWTCLRTASFEHAAQRVVAAIRSVAVLGASARYHDTITRAWLRIVAIHLRDSGATSFDEFLADHPALLRQDLLGRHYSGDLLRSEQARIGWVDPDLCAFPAHAA